VNLSRRSRWWRLCTFWLIESLVRGASILKSLIGASGTTHRV
jgi:hypothetical protein